MKNSAVVQNPVPNYTPAECRAPEQGKANSMHMLCIPSTRVLRGCGPFFFHGALRDRQSLSFAAVVLMEHSRGLFSWTNLGGKKFPTCGRKKYFIYVAWFLDFDRIIQTNEIDIREIVRKPKAGVLICHTLSCTHMVEFDLSFFFFCTHHQREGSLPWHDSDQTWQQHLHRQTKTISVQTHYQTLLTAPVCHVWACYRDLYPKAYRAELLHTHTPGYSVFTRVYTGDEHFIYPTFTASPSPFIKRIK